MSSPLHILCITRACRPNAGGMERLSYELTQELGKGKDVTVALIAHQGSRRTSPVFVFTCLPKALKLARKADVIHLGDPLLSFTGWVIKTFTKKPIAVTVHGLDVTYPNIFYQLYLKLFFRNFDRYLPISTYVKGLLKHIPESKVTLINPGIHDQYYNPSITREDLDTIVNMPTHDKVVLFTSGRLTPRKGHAWFITHVLPQLPEKPLYVIAGTGAELNHIQAAAKDSYVADQVKLLGRVSDKDLKTLYNSVDAFIQPNISLPGDTEGFGLVLAEAASCAKPVFASNIEGITDAIIDGKNGRILPAEQPATWIKVLQDWINNGEYKNKSQAVLARTFTLEKFNWPRIASAYIETFRGILKR